MTPSKQVKASGLKSLAQLSRISGVPVSTLKRWYVEKPDTFKTLIAGALVSIKKGKSDHEI